jgi:hypothetical protein
MMRGTVLALLLLSCGGTPPGGGVPVDGASDGSLPGCSRDQDCDDGSDCTADRCTAGACANTPLDCSAKTDACNTGTCVEGRGCVAEPRADGTVCDDGHFCSDGDACDNGTCVGVPRDCSVLDGPCASGACSESAGACTAEPLGDDTPCEDGLVCTVRTTCQGGACVGDPFDCSALDSACTAGRCDEAAAACVADALGPFPGLEGPLGDPTCSNGLDDDCNGLTDLDDPVCSCPDCNDGDVCTFDGCDAIAHTCFWAPRTVDPGSPVLSSSADDPSTLCLVAGSGGRGQVWADLRDTGGSPIAGAAVTMGGVAATESTARPGTYWREIQAQPSPGSAPLAVGVDWCGQSVTLAQIVTITNVPGNSTSGGTGGCSPPDGNLRVHVIAAETGAPISGASVLLGLAEGTPLEHAPEARFGGTSLPASNVATTDGAGFVELYDYGATLAGKLTATAGAPGRAYFTVVDGAASDLVLALPLIAQPPVPTTRYTDGTGTPNLFNECTEWNFSLVIAKQKLEALSIYDRAAWLGKDRCYDSGNPLFGTMVIPENQWVPAQNIGWPLCLLPMSEGTWSLELPNTAATGATENVSMDSGSVSIDLATGGSTLFELLEVTSYHNLGFMLGETVPTPPTSGRSIDANDDYPSPYTVTFSGQPPETDVVGVGAADYAGTNGTGPLMFMGDKVHEWDAAGSTLDIPNSDLNAAGSPAGTRRLAIVAALYLDKGAHPAIPANWIDAVSSVLIRDDGAGGPPFGPSGGSRSVSDFLGIAATTFSSPGDFHWSNATTASNAPLYSVSELGVRTRRYLPVIPCRSENEIRDTLDAQWIVVRPFGPSCAGQECFTLPALPPGFPRAASGAQEKSGFLERIGSGATCSAPCPVAGETCVDPDGGGSAPAMCMGGSGTDADPYFTQDYLWQLHVYDLELAPSFDFSAFDFSTRRALQTHESFNKQGFN